MDSKGIKVRSTETKWETTAVAHVIHESGLDRMVTAHSFA